VKTSSIMFHPLTLTGVLRNVTKYASVELPTHNFHGTLGAKHANEEAKNKQEASDRVIALLWKI